MMRVPRTRHLRAAHDACPRGCCLAANGASCTVCGAAYGALRAVVNALEHKNEELSCRCYADVRQLIFARSSAAFAVVYFRYLYNEMFNSNVKVRHYDEAPTDALSTTPGVHNSWWSRIARVCVGLLF